MTLFTLGNTGTNYRIEGNVASALRSLATRCSTTKAQMVYVLRLNPGRIHSFCDFKHNHIILPLEDGGVMVAHVG